MRDTILFGDCRDTLKQFDEKARMCVTSPPYYGLRDYGCKDDQIGQEQSPEEFVQQLVEVFSLVRDNLTDDGTLWLNIGDSYYNYRSDGNYPKQTVSNMCQTNSIQLPPWSWRRDLNPQPIDYKSIALPIELRQPVIT